MTNPTRHLLLPILALAVAPAVAASGAEAQSLRGSPSSVDRMYHRAHAAGLPFYESPDAVHSAAAAGKVTTLRGNMDYAVVGTRLPYVRPTTLRFIESLGAAHKMACGEPIVVTSGVRPTSRKLRNGHVKSVHPTGMAVDIRKSPGACRDWLRKALLGLEAQGMIEAIEEYRPPHFHIAVFNAPQTATVLAAVSHAPVEPVAVASRRASGRSAKRSAKASRVASSKRTARRATTAKATTARTARKSSTKTASRKATTRKATAAKGTSSKAAAGTN